MQYVFKEIQVRVTVETVAFLEIHGGGVACGFSSALTWLLWKFITPSLVNLASLERFHTHRFAGASAGSDAGCNVIKRSLSHIVRCGRNAGAGSDIRKCSRR